MGDRVSFEMRFSERSNVLETIYPSDPPRTSLSRPGCLWCDGRRKEATVTYL